MAGLEVIENDSLEGLERLWGWSPFDCCSVGGDTVWVMSTKCSIGVGESNLGRLSDHMMSSGLDGPLMAVKLGRVLDCAVSFLISGERRSGSPSSAMAEAVLLLLMFSLVLPTMCIVADRWNRFLLDCVMV